MNFTERHHSLQLCLSTMGKRTIKIGFMLSSTNTNAGADPGFQVRGAHLKKSRRAEGGAKNVGIFRVKNHDFTPKNHIFSNFRGERAPADGRGV